MTLEDKIQNSINLIKKAESLALQYSENGFHLGFSGGKDSIVLYELAKMAGVKFIAEMQVTTIDPPELMKYIRRNYTDVILKRPKINFYKLIVNQLSLPSRIIRFCCKHLKESSGGGTVTLLGIRKEESLQRSKRNEFEMSKRKYSGTLDQFNIDVENKIVCVKGKDKLMLMPILEWTEKDVWNFIKERKLEYCSLYDDGFRRIGCIFCPMATKKEKKIHLKKYPLFARNIKKSIKKLMDMGKYKNFENEHDVFEWWISGKSTKKYMADKTQQKLDF